MRKISTDLGSIYSSLNLKLDKFESSVTKALQGFYKLQTGTEKASFIMDKSIYTSVSNISKSYELWEKANENTGRSIFDNSNKIDRFKSQIKLLDSEIIKSEKTLEDIEKQFGNNSKEAEEYRSHVLDLKLSHSQLNSEMTKAQKETGTFAGRLDLLGKEFEKIDNKFKSFDTIGNRFQDIGSKLTMGVTLPIIGAGTAASKFAMDFGTGMAKVSTIADTTKVPMDKLKTGVVELSNKVGVTTKDLNEALYETLSAGVDTAKSIDFLNVAVKAAKGGFTDTATAVDGLTTVLNSYGLAADEADKIANQMLITQNLGKTTFGELASSIGKVTPIAAALGISTDELFSSLSSTTSQGLATAESVTALKAAMSNIIKPSKEASEAAEMLGIEFSTSAVKSKGWIGFLQEVREKLKEAAPTYDDALMRQEKYTRLIAESEKAGGKNNKQLQEYKDKLKEAKQEVELLTQAQDSTIGGFATMFGSVEGLNSVLMLTSEGGMNIYNESMSQMKNNTTALDDAFNKMSETTEEKFNKSINKLKNSAMELGVKLLPTIEKGINLVSDLADKFSNLSPSTQEWIVKVGLATAALGPFMSAIGGTIKGVGGLISTGGKLGTFFGLFKGASTVAGAVEGVGTAATLATGASAGGGILGLGTSLGGLAVAAAPWLIAGAAVIGVGYGIHKAMSQEVIPKVDLFADSVEQSAQAMENFEGKADASMTSTVTAISQGTKQAVGAYVELDKEAKKSLDSLYLNSAVINENIKNDTLSKYTEMFGTVKNEMANNNLEQLNLMNQYFLDFRGMDEKEKADLLSRLQSHNQFEISQIDNKELRIKEILELASSQKRALSLDEQQEIATIQNEMKETAVKVLSESETEAKVILQRMKDYDGRITAEQASEHILKLNESKDKAITAANEEYDKRVATIIKMRDEAKVITAEQAEVMINNATRQRDDVVKKAEEMKNESVRKITDMHTDISRTVDLESGKVLTWWDKLKTWWNNWWPQSKTASINVVETKSVSQDYYVDRKGGMPRNASGTRYFEGGLTTMHERGYEVYNLPQGSRIYNHQASEAMVRETAKQVAESVLQGVTSPTGGDIIIPISIAGEAIDRIVVPRVSNRLAISSIGRR